MPTPPVTGLPVEAVLPDLRRALAAGAAAVLEAPPGAGKTTLVPLHLLAEPWLAGRRVLMLEPRRLAARAAAARMAELLGEPVGETVGYAMRFDRKVGRATRIEVVTEGLLTRYLQRDAGLAAYGAVIFDEFHERSLDADLGLALCLEVQELCALICGCWPCRRHSMVPPSQRIWATHRWCAATGGCSRSGSSIWAATRPSLWSCGSRAPSSWPLELSPAGCSFSCPVRARSAAPWSCWQQGCRARRCSRSTATCLVRRRTRRSGQAARAGSCSRPTSPRPA